MKFGYNSSFRGEVVSNCGRTTEPAYTTNSPEAFGSGELKIPILVTDTLVELSEIPESEQAQISVWSLLGAIVITCPIGKK